MNNDTQVGMPLNTEQGKADYASRIAQISATLHQSSGWMKLIAVITLLGIAFTLIHSIWTLGRFFFSLRWSLVSLALSIIPVWTSVLLFRAASHVSDAAATGNDQQLRLTLDQLRLYFKINGVLLLIGLVITVLGLLFGLPAPVESIGF